MPASPVRHLRGLNLPLILFCLSLVTSIGLAGALVYSLQEQQRQQWSGEYGQALANLAARRALDSTLNHDLVSLQVILSDIAENRSVLNATIHDVENNLLVQAGQRQNTSTASRFKNFSAPITLHNSIAGYVTITLDTRLGAPFNSRLFWLFGLLVAVLVALTLCYSFFSRGKIWELATSERSIPIVETSKHNPNITALASPTDDDGVLSERGFGVQLIIHLMNYSELSRQVSSQSFRALNQGLEQHLTGVMSLYNGEVVHAGQDFLYLQFYSNQSQDDAAFNGLCAALLLQQLNQGRQNIQLQINTLVTNKATDGNLLKNLPYHFSNMADYYALLTTAPNTAILVLSELMENEDFAQRFSLSSFAAYTDILLVEGVSENYQHLLDKQQQQLSRA